MIETEFEGHSLAARYARLQDEMNTLHDGPRLRSTAEAVLNELPHGRVALYSLSEQGAGLAAACAALRAEQTIWQRIHIAYPPAAPAGYTVVVVEPVAGGAAWLQSITAIYPGARVISASELSSPALAA